MERLRKQYLRKYLSQVSSATTLGMQIQPTDKLASPTGQAILQCNTYPSTYLSIHYARQYHTKILIISYLDKHMQGKTSGKMDHGNPIHYNTMSVYNTNIFLYSFLFIYHLIYPSVCLSVYLSVRLSACLSVLGT